MKETVAAQGFLTFVSSCLHVFSLFQYSYVIRFLIYTNIIVRMDKTDMKE